jgi:uncharacterized protein involved in exopolysaccharide biosynthesis
MPFPSGPPAAPPRSARDLVAVLYRQAGLVATCALVGSAVSALLVAKQPRLYTSSAKVWVQTAPADGGTTASGPARRGIEAEIGLVLARANAQAVVERLHIRDEQLARGSLARLGAELAGPAGAPAARARTVDLFLEGVSVEPLRPKTADTSSNVLEVRFECADPALAPRALQALLDNYLQLGAQQDRRLGGTAARALAQDLDQARRELGQAEDRIVRLLAGAGAGADADAGVALKLDPAPPGAGVQVGGPAPAVGAPLALRLDADDMRGPAAPPPSGPVLHADRPLEAALYRLEGQRQFAQARYAELQGRRDRTPPHPRTAAAEADSRVIIDAPDHPGAADGRKPPLLALLGPLGGLLLGLLLAGLRELGGDRMRSPREAEWALGAPVLGAIPTLSAKARSAFLVQPAPAADEGESRFA